MVEVVEIYYEFKAKDKKAVMQVFGQPSFEGRNDFDQYEIRYDFDPVPETNGKVVQHLSFIMEEDKVARVEANIIPH